MRVRSAELKDAAMLASLSGELGYPASPEQVNARLRLVLGDSTHAAFVAETEAGAIAGWVHVYRYLVLESDPRAEVGGLVASPEFRRQGVGRLLMQRAEAWARAQGLTIIGLRSNTKRTDAHLFYEKLGYAKTKTQFSFLKQL